MNEKNDNTLSDGELEDIATNKETAAASYTLLFAPLLLVTRRDSKFVIFHARQGFILALLFLLLWWVGSYFSPFRYATIIIIFGAVIGFLQALGGHKYSLPVVASLLANGFTPQGIFKSVKNSFALVGKIFTGAMPKKVSDKITQVQEKKSAPSYVKVLEARVERLEKIVEEMKGKDIAPQ